MPCDRSPCPSVLPKGGFALSVQKRPALFANILYLALSLIIMGVGYLKANITSIVGQLYPAHDPRRDAGFTLYYYGMNLGAFWAAIDLRGGGPERGLVGRIWVGRPGHGGGAGGVRAWQAAAAGHTASRRSLRGSQRRVA